MFPNCCDLGDKLKGAFVSNNYPIDETSYSFNRGDLSLFIDYELDVLEAVIKNTLMNIHETRHNRRRTY